MGTNPYPSAHEARVLLRRILFVDKRREKGLEAPMGLTLVPKRDSPR